MGYSDHFKMVDDILPHIDATFVGLPDPFLRSRYVGFFAVTAVTVFELSIKTILIEFAAKQHVLFGGFCAELYDKLNGRIMIKDLRNDQLRKFGEPFDRRFKRHLAFADRSILKSKGYSVVTAYGNLITWRHSFAHNGNVPVGATYEEAKRAFEAGKIVMRCLSAAMR